MEQNMKSNEANSNEGPVLVPADALKQFNLRDVIRAAREDAGYFSTGRTTRMLTKGPGLRIGVVVMKSGSRWEDHKTPSRIIVQPVEGRIRFALGERSIELGTMELLTLEPNEVHSVEAPEDAAFLLTLC
jgi:quercetin dioxygenase-like cupin family protein